MNWFWAFACFFFSFMEICAWDRTLVWDANPSDENITHYTVYQGPSGGPYTQVATGTNTNAPLVNQSGIQCFVVTATNSIGESDYSDEVCGPRPSKTKNLRLQ